MAAGPGLTTGTVREAACAIEAGQVDALTDRDRPGRPEAGLAPIGAERYELIRVGSAGENLTCLGVTVEGRTGLRPGDWANGQTPTICRSGFGTVTR